MKRSKSENRSILKSVNATLLFEGLKPSKVANESSMKMLNGEISGDEARRRILSSYNLVTK